MSSIDTGCILELEHRVACGDGHIDHEAGEACEPDDLASFAGACAAIGLPNGTARCSETCEIVADVETCTPVVEPRCGDGVVNAEGEDCDGPSNLLCPGDELLEVPCLDCQLRDDMCPAYCGDGDVDPGEECDDGDVPIRHSCIGIDSPHQGLDYGGGNAVCVACRWDRSACSFCGNGTREDDAKQVETDPVTYAMHEACDGNEFELGNLSTGQCAEGTRLNLVCTAVCEAEQRPGEPQCCVVSGAICDPDDADRPCCSGYPPNDDGPACVVDPNGVVPPFCR